MRLPWPFNRAQRAAAAPADTTDAFSVRPNGPQAWRDLPALQRSVGEPPLIAPTPPFRDELASAAPAPIALAPLSHGHGLEAPRGIARNVAIATPSSAVRAMPPLRRRPSAAAQEIGLDGMSDALSHEPATTPTSSASKAPPRSMTPAPHAQVVQPRPALVSAARQPFLPALPVGRVGPSRSAGVQRAPISAAPTPAFQTAPLPGSPAGPVQPKLPRVVPAAPVPEAARLTLGQSRRRGLGAPIDPEVKATSRSLSATEPNTVADLSVETANQPVLPAPEPRIAVTPLVTRVMPTVEPSTTPQITVAPVRRVGAPAALAAPIQQRSARSSNASGRASSPLVGVRPLRSAVQRAPIETAPRTGTDSVRIHRGAEANQMAQDLEARAFTHGGDIYLPDGAGPLGSQKAQSLLAHEMTHVRQQRQFGSGLPDESTPHGEHLEAEAAAAETHEMPLAATSSSPAPKSNGSHAESGRSSSAGSFSSSTPSIRAQPQRAPSANDAKFTNPDDEFRDRLESNEDYLFARFERRLRHALLHERERGGTLIDAL